MGCGSFAWISNLSKSASGLAFRGANTQSSQGQVSGYQEKVRVVTNPYPNKYYKATLADLSDNRAIIGVGKVCIDAELNSNLIMVGGVIKHKKENQGFMLKLLKRNEYDFDSLLQVICLIEKDIEMLKGDIRIFMKESTTEEEIKKLEIFKNKLEKLSKKLKVEYSKHSPYVDIQNNLFEKESEESNDQINGNSIEKHRVEETDEPLGCKIRNKWVARVTGKVPPK
jgi:hypothetical protein